jgi:hypothetical protein
VRDIIARRASAGEPITVDFAIVNIGGTATTIIEAACQIERMHDADLRRPPDSAGRHDIPVVPLEAGEEKRFVIQSTNVCWDYETLRLTEIGPAISFVGRIIHEDGLGYRRRTAFRRKFAGFNLRFCAINDDEQEYSD